MPIPGPWLLVIGSSLFSLPSSLFPFPSSGPSSQNHMGIRASHAEGADAGAAGGAVAGPGAELALDGEGAVGKVDLGIGLLEVEAGGNLLVFQGQGGFDQSGDASGGVEVAQVGFDGADSAAARMILQGSGEGSDFDGVAEGSAGAVGFDVA